MNENDSKNPIISKLVQVTSVQKLDFKSKDGDVIQGIKVFYTTSPTEEQKDNYIGGVCEYSFFSGQLYLEVFERIKLKKFPASAEIIYEVVSLSKAPKPRNIEFK